MTREWVTKSFKSGNSVAIRLPKALGFVDGEDVVMVAHADGSLAFWKQEGARDVFLGLYGAMSPGWMADGRDDGEQADYAWTDPAAAAA